MLDEKDLQARFDEVERRLDTLEQHMEEMEDRLTAKAEEARRGAVHEMQVIIENPIMPSLKLLAEGQQTILQTMAPKSKTEELEEEIDFLKAVVRAQSQRIEALEKRLA